MKLLNDAEFGEYLLGCQRVKKPLNLWWMVLLVALWIVAFCFIATGAYAYTDVQICNAIGKAENSKTHPFGILIHYKTTTPRQACLNTIAHARRDWNGKGDFIVFLGNRYCPVGAANDPRGLNVNWIGNVKYFLRNG